MGKYYFLINALPPLKMGTKPEVSFEEVESLVGQNVNDKEDLEKILHFKQWIDIANLRLLWMDIPIDPRGNLNRKELEAALLTHDFFPFFVFDFLETYEDISNRLTYFLFLISKFLQYYEEMQNGFLHAYYHFKRETAAILTSLRAKDLEKDISVELQYEDPKDFLIRELVGGKEMEKYSSSEEYEELKNLYISNKENPKKLAFAFSEFSFRKIEEMKTTDPFSIDAVLAYMARLILVEDWWLLDENKGKAIISSLL